MTVLIGKFEREGLILTDRRRNRLAWDLLVAFTKQVGEVRELQRKIKGSRPDQELYRDYLSTVLQATDEVSQRRKREQILDNILRSLFARTRSGDFRLSNVASCGTCLQDACVPILGAVLSSAGTTSRLTISTRTAKADEANSTMPL